MIGTIAPKQYEQILRINKEFVHWLFPMDRDDLKHLLSIATYARQINDGQAILIAYPHDVDYPDHWNLNWLRQNFDSFFYIDRVIVDATAQGQGLGTLLYQDVESFACEKGYTYLCCEVYTQPDNPASHKFHLARGFSPCGDQAHATGGKIVRYYAKRLS